MIALPPFVCQVISVYDGDTFTCSDGAKVRMAGADANELHGKPCHTICAKMSGEDARDYLKSLIINKPLLCQPLGRSYQRIVARCSFNGGQDLPCRTIKDGAAVRWDRYWRAYHMADCP